jgi:GGDEF domain-containing protein
MNRITNNLWLGSQRDADDLVRHNPQNITAILNVRGPDAYQPPGRDQSADHPGKPYKWIPAPDIGVISAQHTKEALAWLQQQTDSHHRILIHCKHGISRSPAFLAAFLVKTGIAANLEDARARIMAHRSVEPAIEIAEPVKRVVLISAVTGLPNRQAFDRSILNGVTIDGTTIDGTTTNGKTTDPSTAGQAKVSPFLALANVDLMKSFNTAFGHIAGDQLLRRLGSVLVSLGLDAYHFAGDEFLCKGESHEELHAKLSEARQRFRKPFQLYAEGRIQTIEEADFSFAIGPMQSLTQGAMSPSNVNESLIVRLEALRSALRDSKRAKARAESPEWLRQVIATDGFGDQGRRAG